ncbi:phage holin family protein [Parasphingopyxis marina]|uniref:Phage holin family protein n=1 Tax=Parasphingopyxis marina TaxID=2761622 RepID=A0A842HY36_9SPHN|nr:phage holin family protein [Parasphingopyxis marina]MBC2777765.1 phage holin family protein [Parasphingopyxis marina]
MSDNGREDIAYGELLARLFEDGERFARARLKLYRALIFYRISQARMSALLMLSAVLIAAAACVALMLALVVSLAQYTGPFLAGIIVGGGGLAIAVGLGYAAVRRFPDLDDQLLDNDDLPWLPEDPVPDELTTGAPAVEKVDA